MARLEVSFSIEGEVQVVSMIEAAQTRARDLRTPMRAIGKMFLGYIAQNYKSHGGVWGRWKRRRRSYPWPLLERSGTMKGSFYDKVGSDFVEIGNQTDYFKYHQSKAPRSSNLPRRIMMAIDDQQRRESMKILQEHVIGR